jgi:pimeloyl-ACP methyl ester carboxylesterase
VRVDTINGTRLAYEVIGRGQAVVLIHGAWAEGAVFGALAGPLAEGMQVVTYDRRGHGASDAPPGEGTVHDDVADVAALIEHLSVGPAHLAGTSSGANIALRVAMVRPDLVSKVAAHDPMFVGLLDASPQAKPLADSARRSWEAVTRRLETGDHAGGAQFFIELTGGPGAWDFVSPSMKESFVRNAPTVPGEHRDGDWDVVPEGLDEIGAPVLLTVGEQSASVCVAIVDALTERLPNVRQHTIVGAGHVPQLTHPREYAALLSDFFQPA